MSFSGSRLSIRIAGMRWIYCSELFSNLFQAAIQCFWEVKQTPLESKEEEKSFSVLLESVNCLISKCLPSNRSICSSSDDLFIRIIKFRKLSWPGAGLLRLIHFREEWRIEVRKISIYGRQRIIFGNCKDQVWHLEYCFVVSADWVVARWRSCLLYRKNSKKSSLWGNTF